MTRPIGMTDAEARAILECYPHLSLLGIAYRAGRNAVNYELSCGFTDPALIAEWRAGYRSAAAEDRLDADPTWI